MTWRSFVSFPKEPYGDIYVANLAMTTTANDLRQLFER
jgi:hypothetical protein